MSFMPVECFLDTNILVYAAAGRGEDESKRLRALELIEERDFGLSAQVLQEFFVTVTRKSAVRLPVDEALDWIEQLEAFPIQPIDTGLVKIGVEISSRFQISYWDGAILAAAQVSGATTLFSEDLSHGQAYGAVRVVNPFLDGGI
ncbi:MAG: PIN domain-containing protein [Holophagales bacterium]|nr:PIN domain-containing protein [Holophagales bacterium]